MKPDFWAGITGIAISALVWYTSGKFPVFEVQNAGPAFFPRLAGACLFVLAVMLIIQGQTKEGENPAHINKENFIQLVTIAVILVLYYLAIDILGYFASTFLFSGGVILIVEKVFRKKTIGLVFLNSALVCMAIFLVFRILLKTSLPSGILF